MNPPEDRKIRSYRRMLAEARRTHQGGLFVVLALDVLFWGLIALAILMTADAIFAFPNLVRDIGRTLFLIGLGAFGIIGAIAVLAFSRKDTARMADRAANDPRRRILSVFELTEEMRQARKKGREAEHGMSDFLIDRLVTQAVAVLSKLNFEDHLPGRRIQRSFLRLFGALILFAIPAVIWFQPTSTLLGRFFRPNADIPPFTMYTFTIQPEAPQAIYGGEATVAVEIGGPQVKRQVQLRMRAPDGEEFVTSCFQEGPRRFVQYFEHVTQPVEFCFTLGRARSRWYTMDVLLEPRFLFAQVRVTPPDYAQRPPEEFAAGARPLKALEGSIVELVVTSNRELRGGTAQLIPSSLDTLDPQPVEVRGEIAGRNSLRFRWKIVEPALVEVTVYDTAGTPSREPFQLTQQMIPDGKPEVVLEEPQPFVLATPNSLLPVKGYARDDLGLARVELIRALVGYRDRGLPFEPRAEKEVAFDREIQLAALGVKPGDELQFYLEARDLNPDTLNLSASELARVQIISEEEFAEMIRMRTEVEEFAERFRELSRRLDEFVKAVEELQEESKKGETTEELAQKKTAAEEKLAEAREMFDKMAEDFAAFDAEKALIEQSKEISRQMQDVAERMESMSADDPAGITRETENILAIMAPQQERLRNQREQAEQMEQVAKLMREAAKLAGVYQDQQRLVRQLERTNAALQQPAGTISEEDRQAHQDLLKQGGEQQEELRKRLVDIEFEIRELAPQLPAEYQQLGDAAMQVAEILREGAIYEPMQQAVTAAGNQDSAETLRQSQLALEKLKDLLTQPDNQGESNQFCQMCQGFLPNQGQGQGQNVADQTMQQMLKSLMARFGQGTGQSQGQGMGMGMGSGTGMGQGEGSGYFMQGSTMMDVPVYGPDRLMLNNFNRFAGSGSGKGSGQGGAPTEIEDFTEDAGKIQPNEIAGGARLPLELVPEQYRDPLRRYFSEVPPETSDSAPDSSTTPASP